MIPVYNSEKYIAKCLESILNQTYENLEIILVNDGSTDGSLTICKMYAKKDKRIILINKTNEGAAQARNTALEVATGDYYGFVDSDDWISPNYFEVLLVNIRKYNADISRCINFVGDHTENLKHKDEVCVLNKEEFMPLILNDIITSHLWKCLFKKKLFDNILFPPNYVAHDLMVFHEIAYKGDVLVQTDKQLYFYNSEREGNLSNSTNKFKATICRAIAFYERYILSKDEFPEVNNRLLKKVVRKSIASFIRAKQLSDNNFKAELLTLKQFLAEEKEIITKASFISLPEKIAVKFILFDTELFIKVFKNINV